MVARGGFPVLHSGMAGAVDPSSTRSPTTLVEYPAECSTLASLLVVVDSWPGTASSDPHPPERKQLCIFLFFILMTSFFVDALYF
jgi:hypothetical protein